MDGDISPETLTIIDEYVQELEELGATGKGGTFVAAGCLSEGQEGSLVDDTSAMEVSSDQLHEA